MKHFLRRTLMVLAGFVLLAASFAMPNVHAVTDYTATFENLTYTDGTPVPDRGIIPDGTVVDTLKFETNDDIGMQYYWTGQSGTRGLANDINNPSSLTSIAFTKADTDNPDFSFLSIYIFDWGTTDCTARGFFNGSIVHSQPVPLTVGSGSVHIFNWPRVDTVVFSSTGILDMEIDDFTYDIPANNTPQLSIADTDLSFTEGGGAVQIDPNGILTDTDGDADWDGGKLEVDLSNGTTNDRLLIQDNLVGSINDSGTNLYDGTTLIGTLSSDGISFYDITFNANATNARVQNVLRALSYNNIAADPNPRTRTITVKATDAYSRSATDSRDVAITMIDDNPPTMTRNNGLKLTNGDKRTIAQDNDNAYGTDSNGLLAEDVDDTAANITYTITTDPDHGYLQNTNDPGNSINTFTQADINNNIVQYVHDNSTATSDSFIFKVSDDGYNELTGQTFSITINQTYYDITATAGSGGSITSGGNQNIIHNSDSAPITATPDANYHFVKWNDNNTVNPRTFTNVEEDKTIQAVFALDTYSITATAGTGGSITSGGSQSVNHGDDSAPITATPDAGYHFVKWDDDDTNNPRTFTNVQEDKTIEAVFAINTYNVTATAGTGGSITAGASQSVNHGDDSAPITATPDANYHFVKWDDDNTDNPRTFTNVQEDKTIQAVFSIDTYSVTATAGTGGSITSGGSQSVNHGDDSAPITATPDAGYYFVKWDDDNTDNPRTFTNVQENKNIQAVFAQEVHRVTATAGTGGSITAGANQMVTHGDDSAPITATPDAGYYFVKWEDDNTDNPRTFTNVQEEKNIQAVFTASVHVITYDANGGSGSATSSHSHNEKVTLHSGTGFTRTGYIIDGWKIGTVEYMLGALYTMPDNSVTALAVWTKDTDGDGFSDADEDRAGTDKNDPDSTPNEGSLTVNATNSSGEGIDGMNCVLNSAPQVSVTDADGDANFSDVDFHDHTLSLRVGDEEVAQYAINFENGSASSVTTVNTGASSIASGRVDVVMGSNFTGLNLTVRLNSSGYYEIIDADAALISNPRTGDNMNLSLWVLLVLSVLCACTGSVVLWRKIRAK